MKKFILIFSICLGSISSIAQSEKYVNTMKEKIAAVDTTRNVDNLKSLSATFERIADAEKNQWLPYYYAALTLVNSGYALMGATPPDVAKIDPVADKAEALLNKAEALSKDNSEIFVVKKMINTLRMWVDPMSRYVKYDAEAKKALETAKKLNANNPRIYFLEGQDMFYTPEQYGGSKTEAKKLFEEALKRYDTFKLSNELEPNWGRNSTQYFLNQIK